jgi:hypothetical protein
VRARTAYKTMARSAIGLSTGIKVGGANEKSN